MANAFNEDNGINRYTLSLKDSLEGKPVHYTAKPHAQNTYGKATAPMVGGNLSLLAHAVGTNADVDTRGKILFIEDVGEQLYNVERMLLQLKRAGKLSKLKGLVVGGFTSNKDTDRPFGKNIEQVIYDVVREFKFPICFGFPISHEKENVAIIVGGTYRLDVSVHGTTLSSC